MCCKCKLGSYYPVMGTVKGEYTGTKIFAPSKSHTIPNMVGLSKQVFGVFKHVRSSNCKCVIRKISTKNVLVAVWKPYLLKKDNFGLDIVENVGKIKPVPSKTFQVEGYHW